jgi:hypothetical protein
VSSVSCFHTRGRSQAAAHDVYGKLIAEHMTIGDGEVFAKRHSATEGRSANLHNVRTQASHDYHIVGLLCLRQGD